MTPAPDPHAAHVKRGFTSADPQTTAAVANAANRQEIEWWKKLTPLQRVIIAVLRGAMIEKARQDDQKRAYEEAIYGRP